MIGYEKQETMMATFNVKPGKKDLDSANLDLQDWMHVIEQHEGEQIFISD